MLDSEAIILCLILILGLELWPVTLPDVTQMFSATSAGVLLHPNINRKLQILWKQLIFDMEYLNIFYHLYILS